MKIKKIEQKPIITGTITKFIPMPNIKSIVEQVQEASSIAQEAAEQAEIFSQEAAQSARASAQSVSTIVQLKQDTKNFANVASEKAEIAMRASENTQSIIASVTEAAAQAVDNATQAKNAKTAAQLAASKVAQAELKAQQIVQMADDIQNNIENINATKDIVLDAKNRTIEAKNSAINANDNAQNAKVAAETAKNSAVIAKEAAEDAAEEAKSIANDIKQAAEVAAEAIESASSANSSAQSASASASSAATSAETASNSAQSAETAKTAAEASATAAGTSATNAEAAKTAALAAKGAAETAAASAEESATDAGNYAGLAEEAEQDAQAAKTAAEASATAAAGSASAASGSASQAAQKASEAASSATAAQTSATNAEAAKTGAETAQTAAETAQGKAEEAAGNAEQSATTAEWYAERVERFLPTDTASGEIASFPDGADGVPMQSVVVSMEPVQDLHGYDHPWPAGGGKNKFDPSVYSQYVQSDGKYRARAYDINQVQIPIPSALLNTVCTFSFYADMTNAGTLTNVLTQVVIGETAKNGNLVQNGSIGRSTVTFTPTSTEDYVHITFGSNGVNEFTFYDIQLEASSAVTDYAPYSNECPISGRTGADIEHTGVNVWDEEWEIGTLNNTTGLPSPDTKNIRAVNFIPCMPNTDYYFYSGSNKPLRIHWYDATYTQISSEVVNNAVRTTPSNAVWFKIRTTTEYGNVYLNDISINYPSTDTAYHAYHGETISVTFPTEAGTVYGCTLGVVSGELVVDRAMVDLGTLNWYVSQNPAGMVGSNADVSTFPSVLYSNPNVASDIMCEKFKTSPYNSITSGGVDNGIAIFGRDDARYIRIFYPEYSEKTAAEVKADLDGVKLVYTLLTPITYHLTPQEVRTLLGTNNVWSDAGETAVTYKADVQLYIDKKLA